MAFCSSANDVGHEGAEDPLVVVASYNRCDRSYPGSSWNNSLSAFCLLRCALAERLAAAALQCAAARHVQPIRILERSRVSVVLRGRGRALTVCFARSVPLSFRLCVRYVVFLCLSQINHTSRKVCFYMQYK